MLIVYLNEGARNRYCIKMNSLLSLQAAYMNNANIYEDVKNFQKQQHHSESFAQVVEWLQECIEIKCNTRIKEIMSILVLKCNGHNV